MILSLLYHDVSLKVHFFFIALFYSFIHACVNIVDDITNLSLASLLQALLKLL